MSCDADWQPYRGDNDRKIRGLVARVTIFAAPEQARDREPRQSVFRAAANEPAVERMGPDIGTYRCAWYATSRALPKFESYWMLETAPFRRWKTKDAIERFHGIGRL